MSLNAQEVLLPARANVYLAPLGTAAPADSVVALAADWKVVGHTDPESLSFATEPEFGEVNSHQSDYPIRRFQTSDKASVSVDLLQWNAANMKSVFGGGTVTETTAGSGNFKFVPPKIGEREEVSCVLEVIDGDKHYRWVFVNTSQIEGVQSELGKGQQSKLPLRLAINGADGADAWYLLTDDPAFDPAA